MPPSDERAVLRDRAKDMGWDILEMKFAYYYPGELHPDWKDRVVSDHFYDAMEEKYREVCEKAGVPASADVVGFPMESPSGRLVASKLRNPKVAGYVEAPQMKKPTTGLVDSRQEISEADEFE